MSDSKSKKLNESRGNFPSQHAESYIRSVQGASERAERPGSWDLQTQVRIRAVS